MHVLLMPLGTAGDVHPFIGLGLALAARGHRITCVVNGYFQALAERAGFEFVEFGTREEMISNVVDAHVWPPPRDVLARALRLQYDLLMQHYRSGETLVVAPAPGFGARIAQLKWDLPLVTLNVLASSLWSDYESPALTGTFANGLPRWCKRFLFRSLEKLHVDRVTHPVVNPLLRELGLPSMSRTTDWWLSPQCVLGTFPDWFTAPQPDWPPQVTLCEFPLWDDETMTDLQPELEQFLRDGPPPIVFTPGTLYKRAGFFFTAAADACQRLGRRAVFLTRSSEQIPQQLPRSVRHFEYVPFTRLLSRAAAIVHHGGIGTCAQAMRAGIPQLIMPLHTDQPHNARQLRRLGAGHYLPPRRFRGPRVARRLEHLLNSPEVARSCAEVAARFAGVQPFAKACQVLEGYAAERGLPAGTKAGAPSVPC